jgi:hypothetical protein
MFYDSIEIDLLNDGNREMLTENRMAIKNCVLTEATINDYLGKEIKGYKDAGLEPEKVYKVHRPLDEIEKVLLQYNGLDVIDDHHPMNGLKDNRKHAIGATGESATIDKYKVLNTVFVTDKSAIRDIEMATKSGGQFGKRCLSCSYDYTPVFENGVFENKHYDLWIKDLKLDHVALVQEGRVQNAQIADSNNILKKVNYMKEFMKSALKGIFGVEAINDSQIEQVMLLNDKAKDNEYKETEKAKDSESAEEKDKEELERIKKMEKHEKEEIKAKDKSKDCADDEESEEEKEHKKAKDSESKEKEIKDAIHKELKEIRNIQSLCSKAIGGALSDSALNLDKEILLNDTLTKLGHKTESKSYEMQKVMLETLVNANMGVKTNKQHISFNDSKNTGTNAFVYTVDNLKKLGSNK